MNARDIQTLYDYNCWANERILSAAAEVPQQSFASARLGYCVLRDTLVHTFSAERRWRARWQGAPDTSTLRPEDFSTLASLREQWIAEQQQTRAYLATVGDAELSGPLSYSSASGQPRSNTFWHTLAHMINHGTQHRSELAMLLTELGHSPGNLDLIIYVSERALE